MTSNHTYSILRNTRNLRVGLGESSNIMCCVVVFVNNLDSSYVDFTRSNQQDVYRDEQEPFRSLLLAVVSIPKRLVLLLKTTSGMSHSHISF